MFENMSDGTAAIIIGCIGLACLAAMGLYNWISMARGNA